MYLYLLLHLKAQTCGVGKYLLNTFLCKIYPGESLGEYLWDTRYHIQQVGLILRQDLPLRRDFNRYLASFSENCVYKSSQILKDEKCLPNNKLVTVSLFAFKQFVFSECDIEVVCVTVPPQCCSVRFNLAFMMFLGFAVVYGLRVNLSVAMVAMVNTTAIQLSFNDSESKECPASSTTPNSSTENPDQPDGVSVLVQSPCHIVCKCNV